MSNLKTALYWLADLGINLVIIFGLVLIIQKWVIAPFDVAGASMCDTLNFIEGECTNEYGEKIIINEAGYMLGEPARGDIVVFRTDNEADKYFIKRIIGLPGETVEIRQGEIYVTPQGASESIRLDEPYLNEANRGKTKTFFSNFTTFTVPEGHYFVLGDNRKASTDSRSCFAKSISIECTKTPEDAYIPRENIRGKAWVVWWPPKNIRIIDDTEYATLP